jgi:hypothetical protein
MYLFNLTCALIILDMWFPGSLDTESPWERQ